MSDRHNASQTNRLQDSQHHSPKIETLLTVLNPFRTHTITSHRLLMLATTTHELRGKNNTFFDNYDKVESNINSSGRLPLVLHNTTHLLLITTRIIQVNLNALLTTSRYQQLKLHITPIIGLRTLTLQFTKVIPTIGRPHLLSRITRNQLSLTFFQHIYHRLQLDPMVAISNPRIVFQFLTFLSGEEPAATAAVNPWADQCPVPYHFWVNSFYSNSTFVSLTVSYNGGTFLCPNTPSNEITYNGVYDMYCDDDGLVRVITDGQSWITISEWSWCLPIPRYIFLIPRKTDTHD